MSELVKRLRRLCKSKYLPADKDLVFMLYKECTDEIERLEKERDELKARLAKEQDYDETCARDNKPCDAKKFVEATVPALRAALEELGVPTVEKKLFDAMTREAAKYKMLYDALLAACVEQGFVPYAPKPPKE